MTTPAGKRNQRITIQQQVQADDALGNPVGQWADVVSLWAAVLPIRGREYFAAGQMQDPQDVKFVVLYRPGINQQQRILWRGDPYAIHAVIDVGGAQKELELMTVNGLRDGR